LAKAAAVKIGVVEFTSDRLRLLKPFITDRVVELALNRIVMKEKFFTGARLNVDEPKHIVKVALLVAYELNPHEDFQVEEEALIRGIDADTLRERKKGQLVRPL
jgi:hypothetical protein